MVDRTCACGCSRKFKARQADINRGWGRFFSKSCKAKEQERRTGQNRKYHNRQLQLSLATGGRSTSYYLARKELEYHDDDHYENS